MNRALWLFASLAWACIGTNGCAVGVSPANGGDAIDEDAGSATNSGSQAYGDEGDASSPQNDTPPSTSTDAGSKSPPVVDSGTSSTRCAPPSTPAGCTCATGQTCAANNCYNGYVCDTSDNRCKAPSACP